MAKVITTKPFTIRDASTGALLSPAKGSVLDVTSEVATALIADGLAQTYTLITPTGTKTITENGTNIDVASYAKADVAVPGPTGNIVLSENAANVDIAQYATATVMVPNPSTGTLEITAEGTHDCSAYAFVHVEIAAPTDGTAPTE